MLACRHISIGAALAAISVAAGAVPVITPEGAGWTIQQTFLPDPIPAGTPYQRGGTGDPATGALSGFARQPDPTFDDGPNTAVARSTQTASRSFSITDAAQPVGTAIVLGVKTQLSESRLSIVGTGGATAAISATNSISNPAGGPVDQTFSLAETITTPNIAVIGPVEEVKGLKRRIGDTFVANQSLVLSAATNNHLQIPGAPPGTLHRTAASAESDGLQIVAFDTAPAPDVRAIAPGPNDGVISVNGAPIVGIPEFLLTDRITIDGRGLLNFARDTVMLFGEEHTVDYVDDIMATLFIRVITELNDVFFDSRVLQGSIVAGSNTGRLEADERREIPVISQLGSDFGPGLHRIELGWIVNPELILATAEFSVQPAQVSEPGPVGLLTVGFIGLWIMSLRRRRRRGS